VRFLKCSYIATAITAILSVSSPCFAATSANVHVSATVLPFVSFNAIQNVTSYQVNSDDIKRGYIDLPNSMTVNVKTNLNTAVPVIVENSGGDTVLIRESGRANFVGNTFTLNTTYYRPNTLVSKNYDSRIVLSADARDGIYPLIISMAPAI
jgi:hypothetical protein